MQGNELLRYPLCLLNSSKISLMIGLRHSSWKKQCYKCIIANNTKFLCFWSYCDYASWDPSYFFLYSYIFNHWFLKWKFNDGLDSLSRSHNLGLYIPRFVLFKFTVYFSLFCQRLHHQPSSFCLEAFSSLDLTTSVPRNMIRQENLQEV